MDKTEKNEMISQIKEKFSQSTAVFLIDYHGVNVDEINGLRREFIKEGINYKVFKNTLVKKALQELDQYEKLNDLFVGMTGIAFAGEDYVAPAKIIKKFNDKNKKFSLKGCYIESQYFAGDQLKTIASMLSKDEVMAGIVRAIASPATSIVGTINAVLRDLVSVIDEVGKTKAA